VGTFTFLSFLGVVLALGIGLPLFVFLPFPSAGFGAFS
jgi:hypothetical protein